MGFRGYKLLFELHARHRSTHFDEATSHMHTFRITLYMRDLDETMDLYQDVEKQITEQLDQFQNRDLDEMNIFQEDTTVEGIGSVLFDLLKGAAEELSFQLVRLEIADNPVRCFSVSESLMDDTVNMISRMPYLKMDEMSGARTSNFENEHVQNEATESQTEPAIGLTEESNATSAETVNGLTEESDATSAETVNGLTEEDNVTSAETVNDLTGEDNATSDETEEADSTAAMSASVSLSAEKSEDTAEDGHAETPESFQSLEAGKAKKDGKTRKTGKTKKIFKVPSAIQLLLAILLLGAVSAAIVWVIAESNVYPRGSDTFNHMFRGRMIYEGIKEGNYYLLYTDKWYNGIEIMRYWSPIPLYLIAGCIALAGGNILNGYLVLVGALVLIGGIGWIIIGKKMGRIWIGLLIGILWFLLPDNMRVLFNEGNIPRTVAGVLLPYLFLCIHEFTEKEKWGYLFPTAFLTAMIALCHLMIAAMVGITVFIYLLVHSIVFKKIVPQILMLMGMVLSFAVIGIWLYGALQGGFMEMNAQGTAQVMKDFFADGFRSLNPAMRFSGDQAVFYFGLAIFLVALAGCFFAKKESIPGFVTVLFLFFSTTNSSYELYSRLPLHQFFWMIRFIPVGLAAALFAFLLWKGLKKWVVALLLILLIADCSSSLCYLYVPKEGRVQNVEREEYERAQRFGILQAKALTTQRMAIYDLSAYGAFAAYMVSGVDPETDYSFGWAWQGAETAENLVALNEAYSEAFYLYLFDRSLELGNDVILFKKDVMKLEERPSRMQELTQAGNASGYELVEEGNEYLIFKLNCEYESFGLVSKYRGIAIGSSARDMAKLYPGFEEAGSDNLDDYEISDLQDYQSVYLSGFTYLDKEHFEQLLVELDKRSIQVVINMNHIPEENSLIGNNVLGVTAHPITFKGTYPELIYKEKTYVPRGFGASDVTWSTMYLNGLEEVTGYSNLDGKVLDFAGSLKAYPNITFMGYNLIYHTMITKDDQAGIILEDMLRMSQRELPIRRMVPVTIKTTPYHITVESPENHVNTTLACYDIFESDDSISNINHLLYVDEGTTEIEIQIPYFKEGLILSIAGSILFLAFAGFSYRIMKRRKEAVNEGSN